MEIFSLNKYIIVTELVSNLLIQGKCFKYYWGISHIVSRTPSSFLQKPSITIGHDKFFGVFFMVQRRTVIAL